jgi:hypothetical protein
MATGGSRGRVAGRVTQRTPCDRWPRAQKWIEGAAPPRVEPMAWARSFAAIVSLGLGVAHARAEVPPPAPMVAGPQDQQPTAPPTVRAPLVANPAERQAVRGCPVGATCRPWRDELREFEREVFTRGAGPWGRRAGPEAGRDPGRASARPAVAGRPAHARPAGHLGPPGHRLPGLLQGRPARSPHHARLARALGAVPRPDHRRAAQGPPARGSVLRVHDRVELRLERGVAGRRQRAVAVHARRRPDLRPGDRSLGRRAQRPATPSIPTATTTA